jgi:hypothetical protein
VQKLADKFGGVDKKLPEKEVGSGGTDYLKRKSLVLESTSPGDQKARGGRTISICRRGKKPASKKANVNKLSGNRGPPVLASHNRQK